MIEVINAQYYEIEEKMVEKDRRNPAQIDRHIQIARGYPYMTVLRGDNAHI
jgi:hypothetical protein